jgi:hypothetical protein
VMGDGSTTTQAPTISVRTTCSAMRYFTTL